MKTIRFAATFCVTFFIVLLVNAGFASEQSKSQPVSPASTEQFQIRNIEGWTAYIKKQDMVEHTAGMDKAIEHLQNQLYQIRLVAPSPAVAIMQQRIPIWMEYDTDPGMGFHPSYKWLLERGYPSPEGLTSMVSNCRSKDFCDFTLIVPDPPEIGVNGKSESIATPASF